MPGVTLGDGLPARSAAQHILKTQSTGSQGVEQAFAKRFVRGARVGKCSSICTTLAGIRYCRSPYASRCPPMKTTEKVKSGSPRISWFTQLDTPPRT